MANNTVAANQQQPQAVSRIGPNAGKHGNNLPLWGNEKTMNLNPMVLTNVLSSPYFKVQLYELKTYHEVVDEIYFKVTHVEPWEKGSRKTAGQTGMCGGVRGVGTGGIVSTAFCLLYKLFTIKMTRKQVMGLITHNDSPYIRALGFMYIRYTQPPADLVDWYDGFLDDEEMPLVQQVNWIMYLSALLVCVCECKTDVQFSTHSNLVSLAGVHLPTYLPPPLCTCTVANVSLDCRGSTTLETFLHCPRIYLHCLKSFSLLVSPPPLLLILMLVQMVDKRRGSHFRLLRCTPGSVILTAYTIYTKVCEHPLKLADLAISASPIADSIKSSTQPCNLHRQTVTVEWPVPKSKVVGHTSSQNRTAECCCV
uniref:Pre-mRNA-splicing factor 38B n=1 Tax=Oncorhynchus tshawytscha TaxID=74940 RepID=A0A8C8FNR6_ONCTS